MKKIFSILLLLCILSSCNTAQEAQDVSEPLQGGDSDIETKLTQEEIDLIESLLQEVEGE